MLQRNGGAAARAGYCQVVGGLFSICGHGCVGVLGSQTWVLARYLAAREISAVTGS